MHNDKFTILVEMLKSFQAENNRQFAEIRQERKEDKAENNQRFAEIKIETNRQFAEIRRNQERLEDNQREDRKMLMDIWESSDSFKKTKITYDFSECTLRTLPFIGKFFAK